MAGLEQLKKRLSGVKITGQLAGAMKTVASAKYAKVSRMYASYRKYSANFENLVGMSGCFCDNREDSAERDCYIILGHNRGLCAGYNTELHSYALETYDQNPDALFVVCGKEAIKFFEEKHVPIEKTAVFHDISEFEECRTITEFVLLLYNQNKIRSVHVIRQKFVNTLTQVPNTTRLLPIIDKNAKIETANEPIYVPDIATVRVQLCRLSVSSSLYQMILESSMGAQAATLTAMRTAYDNAKDTAEKLIMAINKKRQSAVTTGVIETSVGTMNEGDEEYVSRK